MVASTNSHPLLSILNWLIPSLFVFWENQFVGRCNYTLNVPLRVLQVNKWWLRRKLITKWRSRTKLEKSFSLHTFCYISNNAVCWQFRQLWDVLCYHSGLKKKRSEKVPVVLGRLCAQFSKNLSRLLLPSILSYESFVDSSCFRVFSIFLEIRTDFRKLTSVLCGDQTICCRTSCSSCHCRWFFMTVYERACYLSAQYCGSESDWHGRWI